MDPYASHLPILEAILRRRGRFKTVLEFGMGFFSTPFFVQNSDYVTSVETESKDWYRTITGQNQSTNLNAILRIGPETDLFPDLFGRSWDLVFCDGAANTRAAVAEKAQGSTSVVVCHDSSARGDRYDMVSLADGWVWVDVMDHVPWTAVETNDLELADFIAREFKSAKRYIGNELKGKEHIC
jgi:hypothetical protein